MLKTPTILKPQTSQFLCLCCSVFFSVCIWVYQVNEYVKDHPNTSEPQTNHWLLTTLNYTEISRVCPHHLYIETDVPRALQTERLDTMICRSVASISEVHCSKGWHLFPASSNSIFPFLSLSPVHSLRLQHESFCKRQSFHFVHSKKIKGKWQCPGTSSTWIQIDKDSFHIKKNWNIWDRVCWNRLYWNFYSDCQV